MFQLCSKREYFKFPARPGKCLTHSPPCVLCWDNKQCIFKRKRIKQGNKEKTITKESEPSHHPYPPPPHHHHHHHQQHHLISTFSSSPPPPSPPLLLQSPATKRSLITVAITTTLYQADRVKTNVIIGVGIGNPDEWCTQNCPSQDCPPGGNPDIRLFIHPKYEKNRKKQANKKHVLPTTEWKHFEICLLLVIVYRTQVFPGVRSMGADVFNWETKGRGN